MFHGHVKLNLIPTSATLTQIDIFNSVYKFDSIILFYIIMLVTILRY